MNDDGSNSVHRIQVVHAIHDNNHYFERHDMGDARLWKHEPQWIFGMGMDSVGVAREMADKSRELKPLHELWGFEPLDYKDLYIQYSEELWKLKDHKSVYGPAVVRER